MSQSIYIIDGVRTPIGSPFRSLKSVTVGQLSATLIEGLIQRNKIDPTHIEEVILGNTVSAGTGQNFARQAVYLSGLSIHVPAYVVSHVCGSGLQALKIAIDTLQAGEHQLFMVGGAESASQTPLLVSKEKEEDLKDHSPIDSLIYDGLWCLMTGKSMGELSESLAAQQKISRTEQDAYALESHRKACQARNAGKFIAEIVPVTVINQRSFTDDERPRKNIDLTSLAELPTAFVDTGTITAGNAAVPSDGAALLLVGTERFAQKQNLKCKARILGFECLTGDPNLVFSSGVDAVRKLLGKLKLKVFDIDLFEISEAFAAQAIFTQRQLALPAEKMNVYGGDVALGHPLGAAGTRSLVTLIHALAQRKLKKGIATVCLGGTGAMAIAVENVT